MNQPTTTLELHAYHVSGPIFDIIADLKVDGFLPLVSGDKVYLSEDGDYARVEQKTYSVPDNTIHVELSINFNGEEELNLLLAELREAKWEVRH